MRSVVKRKCMKLPYCGSEGKKKSFSLIMIAFRNTSGNGFQPFESPPDKEKWE